MPVVFCCCFSLRALLFSDDFSAEQKEDLFHCLQAIKTSLELRVSSENDSEHSYRIMRRCNDRTMQDEAAFAPERRTGNHSERKDRSKGDLLGLASPDCSVVSFFPDLHAIVEPSRSVLPTRTASAGTARACDASQLLAYLDSIRKERILERKHRSLISWSRRKW